MRQLLALLLIIGVIGAYFWYIAAVAVTWFVVWALLTAIRIECRRRAGLVARAEQQHTWVLCGDLRGTYGEAFSATGWATEAADPFAAAGRFAAHPHDQGSVRGSARCPS